MRIRAYYNEYIEPSNAEMISGSTYYRDEDIPIIITDITNTKQSQEFIKGLKQVDYEIVGKVENDVYDNLIQDIKVKDRVFVFGKEYRVKRVEETITNKKFANKVARNPNLYERYKTKIIVLGY